MRDDDFPISVRELLAKRVAQRCSNPGCGHPTSGPQEDPTKAVNVGVAAHIAAASPGGPRYDVSMTSEERRSADNGIWLCQTCAKLIDNDESRYPVAKIREWKALAEAGAARNLERRSRAPSERFTRLERLMPELLAEMREDLTTSPFTREFVVYKKGLSFWNSGTAFEYTCSDEATLLSKVQILENMGLVFDVTNKNVKRYRMTEEFVEYLTGR
jgi:hypothetical protein